MAYANGGFPMIWWIWWFIAAFVIYGALAIWFLKSGRYQDRLREKKAANRHQTSSKRFTESH